MECVGFRFLLLVVLLACLVTATATVFGNGMIEKNDETKGVDPKEVMRRNKWQRGRKIGAVETAGQPGMITSERKLASVTNMHRKDSISIRALKSMTTAASKRTSSDEKPKTKTAFHASDHDETKEDIDPQGTGEVFSMLHKDYQTKVRRRPPINNAVPVNTHDQNNKP